MTPALIVDASVLVEALVGDGPRGETARAVLKGRTLAGPEHQRVETFHAIRGIACAAANQEHMLRAVDRLRALSLHVVATATLLDRMWELRSNLTGYDAAYLAAAERLGTTLTTWDSALLDLKGARCAVVTPDELANHAGGGK